MGVKLRAFKDINFCVDVERAREIIFPEGL